MDEGDVKLGGYGMKISQSALLETCFPLPNVLKSVIWKFAITS